MGRISTSGSWSQANDAGFRAWLAECEQMLEDCGLVRTADTGQINPATATIPGANNTDAGYSLWRFNDSLQSVAPVFIKIWYGRGNTATSLRFGLQVGTGADGAGNLTGVFTSRMFSGSGGSPSAGVFNSYAIHREGLAALAFKLGGIASTWDTGSPKFVVQRTCDNTGTPTADGVIVVGGGTSNNASSVAQYARLRFLPTTDIRDVTSAAWMAMLYGDITDSRVGLAPQVMTHWTGLPEQRPLVGSAAYVRGEINTGQQFSMALVGSTPRNYLALGHHFGNCATTPSGASTDIAILWED